MADVVLRVEALDQNLFLIFMRIGHNLIGKASYAVLLVHPHVAQLAVHEVGKRPLKTAHFQLRPRRVLLCPLDSLSRDILFERL